MKTQINKWIVLMSYLNVCDARFNISEISRHLGIQQSYTYLLCEEMIQRGWIYKEHKENHKGRLIIKLTECGKELAFLCSELIDEYIKYDM